MPETLNIVSGETHYSRVFFKSWIFITKIILPILTKKVMNTKKQPIQKMNDTLKDVQ